MSSPNRSASRVLLSTFDDDLLTRTVGEMREELGGDASIAFLFASADWEPSMAEAAEIVQVYGRCPEVVGCSADGLIGTGQESENVAGISLLMLRLPASTIDVVPLDGEAFATSEDLVRWASERPVPMSEAGGRLLLANPARFDGERFLRLWNGAFPGASILGGLASGGRSPETFFLLRDREVNGADALLVGFRGGICLTGVVSQGCRPIGEPLTITDAEENIVRRVGSKTALEMLEEAVESLDLDERRQAQGNIFAGLASNEYVEEFKRGDFLVRNILGGDRNQGALALGAFPRVGQTLQFQMRDRDAADEDLRELCRSEASREDGGIPFAGLLFSCTGRGAGMFDLPDHDAGIVKEAFGAIPLAGFFCNGEIGPVGRATFLHGYTASLALFRDAAEAGAEAAP